MKREPVLAAATVVSLIEAGLVMCVALGWLDISDSQLAAVMAFVASLVAVLAPFVAGVWARSRVTPVK